MSTRSRRQQVVRRGAVVLAVAGLAAASAFGQSGAVRSGIRGRVVIAKELQNATQWPVSADKPFYLTHANVRRSAGRGSMPPLMGPAPALEVVLEGATGKASEVRVLTLEGFRFSPPSLLVPKPARFKVINKQPFEVRISVGGETTEVAAGKFAFVDLDTGVHAIRVKELPGAQAQVRVLEKAIVLPVQESGLIERVVVEGGRYKLGFYHGAEPLTVQEIGIPDSEVVAVDASISANRVVTVAVKDGGLTVVKTPKPAPPKPAPPKPAPPKPNPPPVNKPGPEPEGQNP